MQQLIYREGGNSCYTCNAMVTNKELPPDGARPMPNVSKSGDARPAAVGIGRWQSKLYTPDGARPMHVRFRNFMLQLPFYQNRPAPARFVTTREIKLKIVRCLSDSKFRRWLTNRRNRTAPVLFVTKALAI